MADNVPNLPGGALPPKKETGKVQPKKETVRITLPPKPSAAPTIKLPTLPPGGPTAVPGTAMSPGYATAAPVAAPPPSRATAAPSAAPTAAAAKPAAPVRRPAPAPVAAQISGVDKVLALAAAISGLVAVGSVVWLAFLFKTQ